MKRLFIISLSGIGIIALGVVMLSDGWQFNRAPSVISSPPFSPTPGVIGMLPGRSTETPSPVTPTVEPTAQGTPVVTSPFVFPTSLPSISPTPLHDCMTVFPLDSVEAINFGQTTLSQLEASFGHATRMSGRPPRLRFDDQGCSLFVTLGTQEAEEAELDSYGTLQFLLDRYGPPEAVGITQGNLTMLLIGYAVLLYPEKGVIAIFDVDPETLTLTTPVTELHLRSPYQVDRQVKRFNLLLVDWQPPLP